MAGLAEVAELVVHLSLKDDISRQIKGLQSGLNNFQKHTSNTQRSLGNLQRGLTGTAGKLLALGGITATGLGFAALIGAAKDYESAFAGVRKTVTATEPELQALSQQFRDMAKTMPITAVQLAHLGEAGGALGIQTKDLKEFVRVTALLGVTTDLTADDAANSLGVLGNVLHLTGAQFSQFGSALVDLGNNGASTESQIVAIAERAGAAGKLVGVTTQQLLGFSSAVASLGIEPEAGGTALQKFFIESTKAILKGGSGLEVFAKTAGVSAKSFQKAFQTDAGGALQTFLAGLGKLPQKQQLDVLDKLGFSDQRITRTLLGLANNTGLVTDQMNHANTAWAQNTALTKEAQQRFATFDSQLQITKNVLTDIGITIGSKLLPKLVPMLQRLDAFITSHQSDIEKFGDDLANGFQSFADAIAGINWGSFLGPLQLTAQIAKQAFDMFMALPAPVRTLAITGFAVNKLTGGLLTSVVKDVSGLIPSIIGGGLRGGVGGALGAAAGVVPVFVTNPGFGAGGGGLGDLAGKVGGGGGIAGGLASITGGASPLALASAAAALVATPLAIIAVSEALAGGPEGIARNDEAGRAATASARGLNPRNVPRGTFQGPDLRGALQRLTRAADTHSEQRRIALATAQTARSVTGLRGDTHSEIATIRSASRAQTAATRAAAIAARQTTEAVKDQDLSVTVQTSTYVSISAMQAAVSRQARLTKIIGGSQQMGGP